MYIERERDTERQRGRDRYREREKYRERREIFIEINLLDAQIDQNQIIEISNQIKLIIILSAIKHDEDKN